MKYEHGYKTELDISLWIDTAIHKKVGYPRGFRQLARNLKNIDGNIGNGVIMSLLTHSKSDGFLFLVLMGSSSRNSVRNLWVNGGCPF